MSQPNPRIAIDHLLDISRDFGTEWPYVAAWCGEAASLLEALMDLIDGLYDPDDCWYDHHDYCQTHNLHEAPCPHSLARKVLEAWPPRGLG